MHALATMPAQAKVGMILGWLSKLADGRAPAFDGCASDDTMLASIRAKVPNFLTAVEAADVEAPDDVTSFGKVAAAKLLERAKAKGDKVLPEDAAFLRSWSWLFTDEAHRKPAKDVLQIVDSQAPVTLKTAKASPSSSESKASSSKAKKGSEMAEAMSLFR